MTLVNECLPSHIHLKQVDVWFQDEARVGQRGTVSRVWAIKGTRPRLLRQQQYEYAYVFGAVCPQTAQAVGIVMPRAVHQAMQHHLDEIAANVPEGRHAILVMDRAPWHLTEKLTIPSNITLLPLPACAPELNPIEQVWRWLREHFWANRFFESYEDIVDACCSAWNKFATLTKTVHSICSRSWANLNI